MDKPMSMALKVVRWLLSNARLQKDRFFVVYRDSCAGLLEEPLSKFAWNFEADFGWCPIVIPGWQIEKFKYNSRIVWSKILEQESDEVYRLCLETEQETQSVPAPEAVSDLSREKPPEEPTFKPFIISTHLTSGNLSDVFWYKPNMYNFFLCQRISSPEFNHQAMLIQQQMCDIEPLYKNFLYTSAMFHLTLCTLSLSDLSDVEECFLTLEDICKQHQHLLPTDPIELYGVGTFSKRVLYVACQPSKELTAFVSQLQQSLRREGFEVNGGEEFVPHITLFKFNRKRYRSVSIQSEILKEFESVKFGQLPIRELHLCLMGKSRDEEGFYRTYGSIRFSDVAADSMPEKL